jgi:uncharacterized SAM-binding protein YcdF (DUF218 family)
MTSALSNRRRVKKYVTGALIVAGIAAAGFLCCAERFLCIETPGSHQGGAAVVVLAGSAAEDRQRMAAGIRLMRSVPGRLLILPLRHPGLTASRARAHYKAAGALPAEHLAIGHADKADRAVWDRYGGTYLEAMKTAQIMQRRHLNSAVIVTSAYHMRRTRMAFERFRDPYRLTFTYHAVDHRADRRGPWWLDRQDRITILTEYKKLLVALFRYPAPSQT